MKKIVIDTSQYPDDVERIKKILADKGYEASYKECEELWLAYSKSMAAGWMTLPIDDHVVFDCIEFYIKN